MHTIRFNKLLRELQGERERVAGRLDTLDQMIHTVERWEKEKPTMVEASLPKRAAPKVTKLTIPGRQRRRYDCVCSNKRCPRQGKPFKSARPQRAGKRRFCSSSCSGWTWYAENRRPSSAAAKERSGAPKPGPALKRAVMLVKGDPLTAGSPKT